MTPPIFTLTNLTATLRPAAPWRLPTHPEVMVRGTLGARLFDLRCRRDDRDCAPCEHRATCPIPTWWDPGRGAAHAVRPFVPAVPVGRGARVGPERSWDLQLALMTSSPEPDLLLAMLEEAAFDGLGPERIRHDLCRVQVQGDSTQVIWDGQRTDAPWPEPAAAPTPPVDPDRLVSARVHFRTPWRCTPPRHRPADAQPTAEDLVRAAWQRIRPVQRAQGRSVKWPRWPDPTDLPGTWEHHRFERVKVRSGRQDQLLDLSGHRGVLVLGPEIGPWAGLLAAVSAINIGRQSSYGLGRFQVEWVAR